MTGTFMGQQLPAACRLCLGCEQINTFLPECVKYASKGFTFTKEVSLKS